MFQPKRSILFSALNSTHRLKKAFVFIMLLLAVRGESQTTINLPAYTRAHLHFGFIIGINWADFAIDPAPNLSGISNDSLKTIRSVPQIGFDLGIVTELKLSQYLKLRFVPSLGFSGRELDYNFLSTRDTFTATKSVQSVFLNFPLDIKLISKRLNNFEAYVIAGMKYSTDLASQNNVNQQLAGVRATVRLRRNDIAYEAGGGVEFYLPFFKFGLELKISQGLKNLIIPDNTIYTHSINSLTSKIYLLSFTFEG